MERIHKILSGDWAMRRRDFEGMVSVIMPSILAGNVEQVAKLIDNSPRPMAVEMAGINIARWWELADQALPSDSVAVIPLKGALYSWATEFLIQCVKEAENNPKIIGLVLVVDGPGGMTAHVERAASLLRALKKPSATVVTDMMASAHFWIGTATDRTFIASPLCEVGSVGVLFTHINFRQYYKNAGIDYRDIYPDTADLKNKAVRELIEKGDESMLKEKARELHMAFCDAVSKQLGIPYDENLPLFRGEIFTGAQALELGYVDETGEVEDAVKWVALQYAVSEANNFVLNK